MANQAPNNWKTLGSETVYKNKWYAVRRDTVIRPDGTPGEYNVVEAPSGVYVIALDRDKRIHLISLFRYTTQVPSLELPAGGIDRGEQPLDAAKRELKEEIGLTAKTWKPLGKFQAENGYMNTFVFVFLAQDLGEVGGHYQAAEGITGVQKIPVLEVFELIKSGAISDSQSISALALFALDAGLLVH